MEVNQSAEALKAVIAPFVETSRLMAVNVSDQVQRRDRLID